MLLGANELFVNGSSGYVKVSPNKNIIQIDVLEPQKLVVVLAGPSRPADAVRMTDGCGVCPGKSQSVRFLPLRVLDNEPAWAIELEITKGLRALLCDDAS